MGIQEDLESARQKGRWSTAGIGFRRPPAMPTVIFSQPWVGAKHVAILPLAAGLSCILFCVVVAFEPSSCRGSGVAHRITGQNFVVLPPVNSAHVTMTSKSVQNFKSVGMGGVSTILDSKIRADWRTRFLAKYP